MRFGVSRRTAVAGGVGLGLLGLAGVVAAARRPPAGVPADNRPLATAIITRETLVDVAEAAGTLGYGPEQLIESRLTGTVTKLAPVGSTVDRGMALFRIDDRPVVLMFGELPAYRELTAGRAAAPNPLDPAGPPISAAAASKGADVKLFEENLKALGYSSLTVDDQYTESTAAAVKRWQKELGLEQSGSVELGRVFYAPGPLRVTGRKLIPGMVASGPVLACTGTTRLVTAPISGRMQSIAKPGTHVNVVLPTGKEVSGTVSEVTTPPDDQPDPRGGAGLQALVTLDDPATVNGIEDGKVQIRVFVQERKDVLVVPVGALVALSEGGHGLEILNGDISRIVAVTTGLFADGKVEVSGPSIQEAMTVGMAR